ncbi:fungal specific transcription factor [Colletotrichum orchidophilum]|uniref:Fungal specific transcription factor n=1 Tax=Colletotrichum orchidophilum TaxID=1209926 RepID=A0A1G4AV23_9PEZI|nr:fungal specific transcription factor [Colletotrichum orchidophilum]OHE93019.1 fungal specific transcription factor [Colletotrichum orchidophilum]
MPHLFRVLRDISQRYIELGVSRQLWDQSLAVPQMDADLAALGSPHTGAYGTRWIQQNQQPNLPDEFSEGSMQPGDDAGASTDGLHLVQHPLNSVLGMSNGPQLED